MDINSMLHFNCFKSTINNVSLNIKPINTLYSIHHGFPPINRIALNPQCGSYIVMTMLQLWCVIIIIIIIITAIQIH